MNEIAQIQAQINKINNERIKYQTLKEQAQKQCQAIEEKYGIKSIDELKALVDKAQAEYSAALEEARAYINSTNQVLSTYQGIL